ncbi:MAG: hypothetical protein Q9224_006750 [Gallowayella concinna]
MPPSPKNQPICTPTFATAITQKLTKNPTTNQSLMYPGDSDDEDDIESPTEAQNDAYSSLSKSVYECLLKNTPQDSSSLDTIIATIKTTGHTYLRSHPGHEDTGDDGALHRMIDSICRGEPTNMDECQSTLSRIRYRMEQQSTADRYVAMMGLPLPLNQLCHEFDIRRVENMEDEARYKDLFNLVVPREYTLFPRPTEGQGRPFYKGLQYLMATIDYCDIPLSEAAGKLDRVMEVVEEELEHDKEIFERDAEVSRKRIELFALYGYSSGDISPRKRKRSFSSS